MNYSELSQLFPADEAATRVGQPVVVDTFGFDRLDEICAVNGPVVSEIGAAIGYRMKVDQPDTDLEKFGVAQSENDPRLFEYLAEELGAPTITDLFYGHVQLADESAEYRTIAELTIAVAYPNVLHIGDVEFSNPLRPVAEGEIKRVMTRYKGLGLLGDTFQRCMSFAQSKGLSAVCLTPAEHALVPVFQEHGFQLDQNELATLMQEAGMPGPMRLVV